jgi:hypothetical protein
MEVLRDIFAFLQLKSFEGSAACRRQGRASKMPGNSAQELLAAASRTCLTVPAQADRFFWRGNNKTVDSPMKS